MPKKPSFKPEHAEETKESVEDVKRRLAKQYMKQLQDQGSDHESQEEDFFQERLEGQLKHKSEDYRGKGKVELADSAEFKEPVFLKGHKKTITDF